MWHYIVSGLKKEQIDKKANDRMTKWEGTWEDERETNKRFNSIKPVIAHDKYTITLNSKFMHIIKKHNSKRRMCLSATSLQPYETI